jgi:hypothetical protein
MRQGWWLAAATCAMAAQTRMARKKAEKLRSSWVFLPPSLCSRKPGCGGTEHHRRASPVAIGFGSLGTVAAPPGCKERPTAKNASTTIGINLTKTAGGRFGRQRREIQQDQVAWW